jgi:hypothetical protein
LDEYINEKETNLRKKTDSSSLASKKDENICMLYMTIKRMRPFSNVSIQKSRLTHVGLLWL